MAIFFYFTVLAAGMYWVARTLLPEMLKPVPVDAPVEEPLEPSAEQQPIVSLPGPEGAQDRISKLEFLLAEKNKNITLLQTELKIFHTQVRNFDKVKALLEEEIHRLREQNRIFRSELGLPSAQAAAPKENPNQLFL